LQCQLCGYEHLDVHRTGDALITYCQQCGNETKEKREDRRRRWTNDERRAHIKAQKMLEPYRRNKKKKKRA